MRTRAASRPVEPAIVAGSAPASIASRTAVVRLRASSAACAALRRMQPIGASDAEQLVEGVGRVADDRGAVAEQPVGSGGVRGGHASGNRCDVAADLVANSAVISDPEGSAASTTTVIAVIAAMIRLRAGKVQRNGRRPGGDSESITPTRAICS